MMIVIANKNTTKLIKGHRYEVSSLRNSGSNKWGEGTISIKDIGSFTVKNFTDIDGKPVSNIDILLEKRELLEFKDLKKGDILVCERNNYKNLIPGNMYKIDEIKTTRKNVTGWNGQPRVEVKNLIKLEGHRFIKFNSWCFRKLNTNEAREISLNSVLDGDVIDYVVDTSVRKIDIVDNKDLELMKILFPKYKLTVSGITFVYKKVCLTGKIYQWLGSLSWSFKMKSFADANAFIYLPLEKETSLRNS